VTSWTFGAFTDPDSRIDSYSATLVTVTGSGSLSGSGLGPYSITGTADGDAYTVELDALDGDGGVLATATHTVAIAEGGITTFTAPLFDGVDDNLWAAYTAGFNNADPLTWSLWYLRDPSASALMATWAYEKSSGSSFPLQGYRIDASWQAAYVSRNYGSGSINWYAGHRWQHLMYVQNGSTWQYFVDGRQVDTRAVSSAPFASVRIVIGDIQRAGSQPWYGAIRDVGVWSSDQSAQLNQIIANGPGTMLSSLATPPDLAYWPLDGQGDTFNNGETIVDQTGNGYDLTVRNMTGAIGTYTGKGYNP
jgi:hypothetical protein